MVSHIEQLNNFAGPCVDSSPAFSKEFVMHLCSARKLAMQIAATNMLRATIEVGGTRLNSAALRSIKDGLDVQLLSEVQAAAKAAMDDASFCRQEAEFRTGVRRTLMAHYLLDKPRDEGNGVKGSVMELEVIWNAERDRHMKQIQGKDPILIFRSEQFLHVAKVVDSLKSACSPGKGDGGS